MKINEKKLILKNFIIFFFVLFLHKIKIKEAIYLESKTIINI